MKIREATIKDYDEIQKLWKKVKMYKSWMMNKRIIMEKIKREPNLWLVVEEEGKIVASALGGFDGQFGNIGHVVCDPEYQGKGYVKKLLTEIQKRLKRKGSLTCYLLTTKPDYFKQYGFDEVPETFLTKRL